MSSNDQLVIIEKEKGFEIHHDLCVDNPFHSSKKTLLEKRKTLVQAILYAQSFCNEYPYVEYNYVIRFKKKVKEKKEGSSRAFCKRCGRVTKRDKNYKCVNCNM